MKRFSKSDLETFVVGLVIAVTSIYGIYTGSEAWILFYVAPFFTLLLAALISMIDPGRSAPRSAGIYACAVGITFLINGYTNMIAVLTNVDLISFGVFTYGLLHFSLGLVLVPAGLSYLLGRSSSAIFLALPIIIVLGLQILIFIMVFRHGYGLDYIQMILGWPIPGMICSASILLLMSRKDIRENTLGWKLGRSISEVKAAVYTEPSAYLLPEDVETIRVWLESGDPAELHITLHLPRKRVFQIVFYRVEGDAYMTVAEAGSDSFMSGFHMNLDCMIPDGRHDQEAVRFYSPDGAFARVLIGDPDRII